MSDYTYWQNALKGEFGPVHDGFPQPGFYRKRETDGPDTPCAIWPGEGGKMLAKLGDRMVDAENIWTWVCSRPCTEDDYRKAADGGDWPDDIPGLGHNAPSESDGYEELSDQIKSALSFLADYGAIANQDQCDQAANLRDRLNQLSKTADARRKKEKEPHMAAANAVQKKWAPLIEDAKSGADKLRAVITKWLKAVDDRMRKAAEATGADPADMRVRAGGSHGRKTGLRTQTEIEITDYEQALAAVKGDKDVKTAVEKAVRRRAKAGVKIPGVKITETKVAA